MGPATRLPHGRAHLLGSAFRVGPQSGTGSKAAGCNKAGCKDRQHIREGHGRGPETARAQEGGVKSTRKRGDAARIGPPPAWSIANSAVLSRGAEPFRN